METRFSVINFGTEQQLTLPMPRPYVPIPEWIAATDLLAIILLPIWVIGSGVVRAMMRIEPPPRARFIVARDRFEMVLVARDTGERTTVKCHPREIVELRKNRYEKGLWIHIQGKAMETYLQDIDDDTVHMIGEELRRLMSLDDVAKSAGNDGDAVEPTAEAAHSNALSQSTRKLMS